MNSAPIVGALYRFEDLTQRGIGFADMQAASLENRIEISRGKLVKTQLEVGHIYSVGQAQRIQVSLLVTPLAIGGNQLNHPYLLALVFGGLGVVLNCGFRTHPHLADLGKVIPDDRMRDVFYLDNFRFDAGQFVEVVAPLLRYPVRVFQVGLVQILHVCGVATRDV